RIADDAQCGKSDKVGAVTGGHEPRLAGAFEVAGNIADHGIELCHRNGETVVHAAGLAPDEPARQWAAFRLPPRLELDTGADPDGVDVDVHARDRLKLDVLVFAAHEDMVRQRIVETAAEGVAVEP